MSMRAEYSVMVRRPIAAVFAALALIDVWPAWAGAVREVRRTSAGPLGVGATFAQTVTVDGRDVTLTEEMIAYEPPHTLAYRSIDGSLSLTCAYTLEATAEGTRLALALELAEVGNGVAPGAVIVSSLGRDLDALAVLLEERTAAGL
jgi:uncharacterized protein YndB with AHSA1/START domain